jgi:hypothetical protein
MDFLNGKPTTSAAAPIISITPNSPPLRPPKLQRRRGDLTTGNSRITASQPGIRLPDKAQTEISFLWQTGLYIHFNPQA